MSAKKNRNRLCALAAIIPMVAFAIPYSSNGPGSQSPLPFEKGGTFSSSSLEQDALAEQLGWQRADNKCGGYYIEQPFNTPASTDTDTDNPIQITSNESLFSQRSTSTFKGKVTVTRFGQQ